MTARGLELSQESSAAENTRLKIMIDLQFII